MKLPLHKQGEFHNIEQVSNNELKCFKKKILPGKGLPSGKIPDGIFLQAGLAVLAFA